MGIDTVTDVVARGPWAGAHGGPFLLFPLLFLLLVITILVVAFLRSRRAAAVAPARGAETELGERFARGEIDADEFRERRAVLREKS